MCVVKPYDLGTRAIDINDQIYKYTTVEQVIYRGVKVKRGLHPRFSV